MADVSQIKLPSGTTYDIKDATARANSGVTGVKGSAESSYRTGNVNVTAANVGAVAKSGDTMTGKLTLQANQYSDSYTGGALDLKNSNIDNVNGIYTSDTSDGVGEGINFYRDASHTDTLFAKSGKLYFSPNRALGTWPTAQEVYVKNGNQDFPEAYLTWGGKNFTGSYGPIDSAMIPALSANRLELPKANGIIIEYSRDGGETWIDYGLTDSQKQAIFSSIGGSAHIGKYTSTDFGDVTTDWQLRMTLLFTESGIYTVLNKFATYIATQGASGCNITIEACKKSSEDVFEMFADHIPIGGWSGWNIINTSGITTFGGGSTSQYSKIRFTYGITGLHSWSKDPSHPTFHSAMAIMKLLGFGGVGWSEPNNLARNGNLYTYDVAQNATFPAVVKADGGFIGNVTGNVTGNVSGTANNVTGTVAIDHGGTGATSASAARTNLGLGSAATASTASTVGDNSNLPTGAAVQTYVTGLGYEANQNAFSNVKVGSTTVSADTETDTLELAAGANVTLTPDTTNDKVTIAATDTTYESKAAASGGTAVSLVTTGEKYTWNHKTSNTGTVTSVATGTGLTGGPITTSGTVSLATVHSTAPGAKGDTANQTPAFGGTFKVPSGTVDAYGRTTAFADHTVTIPSATFGRNAAGLVPASGSAVTDMVQILADDGNWYQLDGDIVNVTSSSGSETLTDFVQTTLPDMLDEKQDALVSGTNIKTINSQSILGSGNIQISGGGIVPDDYVIAHGTSGNWYYRKWNSGRIEAWGTLSVTQSKTTAVGQVHRTTWSATIPAAVGFTSAPTVNLSYNVDASVFFGLSGHATSATAISGYAFRYSASTSTSATGISIYCWGT